MKQFLYELSILIGYTGVYLFVLFVLGHMISVQALCLLLVFILPPYSWLIYNYYCAFKITSSPRYFIRRYDNIDLIEYIEVEYLFYWRKWTFQVYNFATRGWQDINLRNIWDYEYDLRGEWLEPITKEQYTKYLMLESLCK